MPHPVSDEGGAGSDGGPPEHGPRPDATPPRRSQPDAGEEELIVDTPTILIKSSYL